MLTRDTPWQTLCLISHHKMLKIAVGSKNPAKLKAAKLTIKKLFPKARIIAVEVPSKVSAQPKSDEESIKGAIERAKSALKAESADFGIGMEGGIHKIGKSYFESGWIAVVNKKKEVGLGSSARWQVSEKISKKLLSGKELMEVIAKITNRDNVHAQEGMMGLITNGHLPRHLAYSHGILFAFAPFVSDPVFWD